MMNRSLRLAVIVAAATTFASVGEAQFSRGIMRDSDSVMLFPIEQPETLLPTGTIRVELKNGSSAPARIIDQLQSGLSRQLAENDSRLRVSPQAQYVVTATVTEWSIRRRTGSKYVSQQRQIGTHQVKDKNGNIRYEPTYEYGHNEQTLVHDGSASIRLEVVQQSTEARLDDITAHITYFDETVRTQSPPTEDAVENAMVDRAVSDAAAKLTPARRETRVLLARSDEVEPFNPLAHQRKWADMKAALEKLTPHKDAKKDAYRLHNLGVAHEAMAYEAHDRANARAELQEADALLARAVAAKKDEKYFVESSQRVSSSLRALAWISEREMAIAEKYPAKTAPARGAAATPKEAPPKLAAASPTKTSKPAAKAEDRMTNADVIDLVKAGLDDKLLIATIREAKTVNFDLSAAGLRALLAAKVSNPVITVMRERAKP
jgi:hypothetical protein